MTAWQWLYTWIALHGASILFVVWELIRVRVAKEKSWVAALLVTIVGNSVVLGLFYYVFVVCGGSSVVQVAGPEKQHIWSFWVGVWPGLLVGTLFLVPYTFAVACIPPWRGQPASRWLSKWLSVAAAVVSLMHIVESAPTA